jgi:DNA modification methylase
VDKNEVMELVSEIESIEANDILNDTGFDVGEIEDMIRIAGGEEDVNTMESEVPEFGGRQVKSGDVYKLGNHRLLCGDAKKPWAYDKLLQGKKAHICFTSPPYNAGKFTIQRPGRGYVLKEESRYQGSNKDINDADVYLDLLMRSTKHMIENSSFVLVNLQSVRRNKVCIIEYLYNLKNKYVDTIIWDKQLSLPTFRKNLLEKRFEYIFIFKNSQNGKQADQVFGTKKFKKIQNVYVGLGNKKNKYKKINRATFPLHLPMYIIKEFSNNGEIILDPFVGTGTTIIASERLGRKCYGIDKDELSCSVAIKRWEDETGRKAKLITKRTQIKV